MSTKALLEAASRLASKHAADETAKGLPAAAEWADDVSDRLRKLAETNLVAVTADITSLMEAVEAFNQAQRGSGDVRFIAHGVEVTFCKTMHGYEIPQRLVLCPATETTEANHES